MRLWGESESSAVIWKDAQEEAARKGAQLAAEKEQERKRKYQEVEDEAEAEEDSFECHSFISACPSKNLQELVEEEKRRIKAAKKAVVFNVEIETKRASFCLLLHPTATARPKSWNKRRSRRKLLALRRSERSLRQNGKRNAYKGRLRSASCSAMAVQ